GTFSLAADGSWSYTVDNGNAAVDALNAGGTLTDSFTALTADGTSQTVSVTIDGANDAAVISGDVTGTVVEAGTGNGGGTPTATGVLTDTDVDNTPNTFQANSGTGNNGYGTFSLAADGSWSYTVDNGNAAVDALNGGGTLTDSFTALTADGTSQTVSVTIDGANDAAVISGTALGTVV